LIVDGHSKLSTVLVGLGMLALVVGCGVAPTDATAVAPSDAGVTPEAREPTAPSRPTMPSGDDDATGTGQAPDQPDGDRPDGDQPGTDPAPDVPGPRGFTIAASGDLLIHGGVRDQAADNGRASGRDFDFRPMFDRVRPVISAADLAICHLEVPLSADNTGLSGYPLFSAPRELAPAIAHAGFDVCSTASNHSMDQGGDGAVATLDLLDDAGLGHAGMARTEDEATTPRITTVEDVEVAHLSYTYGLNGMPLPEGRPWMVDLIDEDRILGDAQRARDAGAEFVIASMHWGAEYQQAPSEEQRRLAEVMLDGGSVDLVLGHHAHVVQPITRIGDRYAVYGMGNFLSNQSAGCCPAGAQDGVIMVIEVEEAPVERSEVDESSAGDHRTAGTDRELRVTEVSYVPTWVDRDDFTIVDVGDALGDPELTDERRETLTNSWERTVEAITAEGADEFGVWPQATGAGGHRAPGP
jgi:poly-gamma-glutamate capsule biosynthesis protein CapA/YwtB (metallophosphatase superfamily)